MVYFVRIFRGGNCNSRFPFEFWESFDTLQWNSARYFRGFILFHKKSEIFNVFTRLKDSRGSKQTQKLYEKRRSRLLYRFNFDFVIKFCVWAQPLKDIPWIILTSCIPREIRDLSPGSKQVWNTKLWIYEIFIYSTSPFFAPSLPIHFIHQ